MKTRPAMMRRTLSIFWLERELSKIDMTSSFLEGARLERSQGPVRGAGAGGVLHQYDERGRGESTAFLGELESPFGSMTVGPPQNRRNAKKKSESGLP